MCLMASPTASSRAVEKPQASYFSSVKGSILESGTWSCRTYDSWSKRMVETRALPSVSSFLTFNHEIEPTDNIANQSFHEKRTVKDKNDFSHKNQPFFVKLLRISFSIRNLKSERSLVKRHKLEFNTREKNSRRIATEMLEIKRLSKRKQFHHCRFAKEFGRQIQPGKNRVH